MTTPLFAILLVLLAALVGSVGPLMFKYGADRLTLDLRKLLLNYHLYIGGFFYALSSILFIWAITKGELSVLYPLVATTYIWVSLLSMYYLKEKMNVYKWLGILAIIIGALFIGLGS